MMSLQFSLAARRFGAVGFVGAVGAVPRSVAQLFEADASRSGHAQQFAQRTLFRIEGRVDVSLVAGESFFQFFNQNIRLQVD